MQRLHQEANSRRLQQIPTYHPATPNQGTKEVPKGPGECHRDLQGLWALALWWAHAQRMHHKAAA